jgi:phosphoglycolate phosphatase-like HAD superfamily hydrolase
MDWDNTVIPTDSGYELLSAVSDYSGEFQYIPDSVDQEHLPIGDQAYERADFDHLMSSVTKEKPRGHSNPLVTFLQENPDFADYARENVHELNLEPRPGFDAVLGARSNRDTLNILSTAGFQPLAQAQTNGHFDGIIAGDVGDEPFYNGRPQKRENLKKFYQQELGREPKEIIYAGDSNGDLDAIKLADEMNGFGVAVGDSLSQAQNKVEEATVYIGNQNEEHHTSGWVLNFLTHERPVDIEEMKDRGLEEPEGEIVIGELADEEKAEELEKTKQYLEGVRESFR